MIEKHFDVAFVANLALREKQIQQNYRPIIAVHKWFARRPGSLFRGLLLSEFAEGPLRDRYFEGNNLTGLRIADPFMGGGTPLLEANRLGCDVVGYDINPMAYWIVREELEALDVGAYRKAAGELVISLERDIGQLYRTTCRCCSSPDASVKYFLWVKIQSCRGCGLDIELFPGYLLAEDVRHPTNVLVCPECGELNESADRKNPDRCWSCRAPLKRFGPARGTHCKCNNCGTINRYPDAELGFPRHRMFAMEYYCTKCRSTHQGRFFKKPDHSDLAKYEQASALWKATMPEFLPTDQIPPGDETDRLHRWGYRYYREMFNDRQLLGLEISCRLVSGQREPRIRNALATNLSDLLRYQNMLCRYDTAALKSLDIFSVHGFPVGLVQCESNLLGIAGRLAGVNVGSGGWLNIIEKYSKAKAYCALPFEVRHDGGRKVQVPIPSEWIGDQRNTLRGQEKRRIALHSESATNAKIEPASLDAVLTDPPYFSNVQYAELIDFCYVWLRRIVGGEDGIFRLPSTRNKDELTGNVTMDRGLAHFTTGLSETFSRMAKALKPGAPLVFTYHHNALEAYYPVAVAILDAGLTCSASLPCPAEMGASIHINGTGSSIVDTVFVCRSVGIVPRNWLAETPQGIASVVETDVAQLRAGGVVPTKGDIRCIVAGHLIRLAIWDLRRGWDRTASVQDRLSQIAAKVRSGGGIGKIESCLGTVLGCAPSLQRSVTRETSVSYGVGFDEVPF